AADRQYALWTMRRRLSIPRPLDVARVLDARRAGGLVAIFDLDGTLAPIAPTPAAARVPVSTRRALRRLGPRADSPGGVVAGRALADRMRLVGRRHAWLAGVHGAARRAPDGRVQRLWSASNARVSAELARTLAAALDDVRGVVIERKGPVVAVHVRAATPAGRAHALNVVMAARTEGWSLLQ